MMMTASMMVFRFYSDCFEKPKATKPQVIGKATWHITDSLGFLNVLKQCLSDLPITMPGMSSCYKIA